MTKTPVASLYRRRYHLPPDGASWAFPDLRYPDRDRIVTPVGALFTPRSMTQFWNAYGWPDIEQLCVMAKEAAWKPV